mmetsp:Transcript_19500/g.39737  ORF Transcript_19500/g.39737 Transcript_19500/m.39737 type:complete len:378 (-) Transcript_19500:204-1337(-)
MIFLEYIRRVPRSAKALICVFIGFVLWSAISSVPLLASLDETVNNRALSIIPSYDDFDDDTFNYDPEKSQDRSLLRTLYSEGILSEGSSFCPDTNENEITNDRKATIVIMSYLPDRLEDVFWLLRCYEKMTGVVEKIIFVWNNPAVDLPEDFIPPQGVENTVPIRVSRPSRNWMTNRFDAPSRMAHRFGPILMVDDNLFVTAGLISGMLDYWKSKACRKRCAVGLDPRYVNPYTQKYELYRSIKLGSDPNVVISKTFLTSNKNIRRFMDHWILVKRSRPPRNTCEDISLSLFITRKLRIMPVFVKTEDYNPDVEVSSQQKFLSEKGEFIGSRFGISDYDGRDWVKGNWSRRRHICVAYNFAYHGRVLRNILVSYARN